MKIKSSARFLVYAALVLTGAIAGIFLQRYLGIGNVLRSVGVAYPTRTPPPSLNDRAIMEIPGAHQGRMHLFILAGQSNMVGWSPIPNDERTDPRIYLFGKDYRWRIASHPIEDASNQVDFVSENLLAGFGPGMDFAFALLERQPDFVIGLIPCAKNSSGIIQWQRDLRDTSLYGSCLKRARAASPMGHIAGILFFQGENDALRPDVALGAEPKPHEWSDLFSLFITDFKRDLGEPELPVVFAELGSQPASGDFVDWEVVKEQQRLVRMPMVTMIITDDLHYHDGLHFTVDSYRSIGRRFADAYWNVVGQP